MRLSESLTIISILLEELSIKGTPIAGDERIVSCGVKNLRTKEVIECDWHAGGREEAWNRGWYSGLLAKLVSRGDKLPDNLRQFYHMYDYELLNEYTEDGFVTTKGRFLGRTAALDLARKSRQLNKNRLGQPWDEEDPYLRSEEVSFNN